MSTLCRLVADSYFEKLWNTVRYTLENIHVSKLQFPSPHVCIPFCSKIAIKFSISYFFSNVFYPLQGNIFFSRGGGGHYFWCVFFLFFPPAFSFFLDYSPIDRLNKKDFFHITLHYPFQMLSCEYN